MSQRTSGRLWPGALSTSRFSALDLRSALPLLFAVLAAVLGCAYAFYTPPFQVPDEPAHFLRAYEVSNGSCVASTSTVFPAQIAGAGDLFPDQLDNSAAVDSFGARLDRALHTKLDLRRTERLPPNARPADIYSCVPYLPQALAIALARAAALPPVGLLYAARLGGLLTYVGLVALALRLTPPAKRAVLFLVAVLPMALFQAASSSEDPVINAAALLFTAVVANRVWGKPASLRRWGPGLVGLAILLGQCKLDICLLPLLLLVPSSQWGLKHGRIIVAAGATVVGVLSLELWQRANHTYIVVMQSLQFPGVSPAANLRFFLDHPAAVLDRFWHTLTAYHWFYVESTVGKLGWLSVELSAVVIVVYALVTAAIALCAAERTPLGGWQRALCAATGLGSIGLIFATFYLLSLGENSLAMGFALPGGVIDGVQGRYFIPFLVPLAWALATFRPRFAWRASFIPAVAAVLCLIASADAFRALYTSFYYPAVEALTLTELQRRPAKFYEGRFVHELGTRPEDDRILYVHSGSQFWIANPRWFVKHRMPVPRHVPVISPQTAKRMPWGGVVSDADTQFNWTLAARHWDNLFVNEPGSREVWLVTNGTRHRLLDARYLQADGFPVFPIPHVKLVSIPAGDVLEDFSRFNGKLVQAADGADASRIFYVENGAKRWVANPDWLGRHGFTLDSALRIPAAVIDRIPEYGPING